MNYLDELSKNLIKTSESIQELAKITSFNEKINGGILTSLNEFYEIQIKLRMKKLELIKIKRKISHFPGIYRKEYKKITEEEISKFSDSHMITEIDKVYQDKKELTKQIEELTKEVLKKFIEKQVLPYLLYEINVHLYENFYHTYLDNWDINNLISNYDIEEYMDFCEKTNVYSKDEKIEREISKYEKLIKERKDYRNDVLCINPDISFYDCTKILDYIELKKYKIFIETTINSYLSVHGFYVQIDERWISSNGFRVYCRRIGVVD